ncbi:methyl-accepting chemotaxis protein [Evansella tamaricis]|uniref:HAMP domain-containing protein n=1 Tax=Evansella tamaricis TaxID=2069301 RepID=A0ABS6JBM3_9BACI|nr:methyl-accepting chemotaxis protein [Evansella tamaricis]MBU9710242.1 HAMP domain-containing protein [Evansella tamaricis]
MNISFGKKLVIGCAIVFLCGISAALILLGSLKEIRTSFVQFANEDVALLELAQQLRFEDLLLMDTVKGVILTPQDTELYDTYAQTSESIKENIEEVLSLVSEEEHLLLGPLEQYHETLFDMEELRHLATRQPVVLRQMYSEEYRVVREEFALVLHEFVTIQEIRMREKEEELNAYVSLQQTTSISIIIFSTLLGAILIYFLLRVIKKPIRQVTNKLEELTNREGDLSSGLPVTADDEIGNLTTAFNEMLGSFRGMLYQVKETTEQIATSSEELTKSSDDTALASNQIAVASQQTLGNSREQLQAVEKAESYSTSMTRELEQISIKGNKMADSAKTSSSLAENGKDTLEKVVDKMKDIEESVGRTASIINELGNRSAEIGRMSSIITGIAEQTNLLSLNAAIEAARAGEHGKGFAVVADEVRLLADKSKESAVTIEKTIVQINEETGKAVHSMKEDVRNVNQGMGIALEAKEVFQQIQYSIVELEQEADQVSLFVLKVNKMSKEIDSLFSQVKRSAKETNRSSQDVSASTQEQLATVEEIASSAKNLSQIAEELKIYMGKFVLDKEESLGKP